MNGAHLHLLINHFPLCTLVVSTLVLLVGVIKKRLEVTKVALVITVFAGLMAIPTFLTGDQADDVLKDRSGYQKELVHEHDQAADFAIWACEITAAISIVALYFAIKKNRIPKPLTIAVVVIHLWALSVVARTSYLGGQINHPEIRGE